MNKPFDPIHLEKINCLSIHLNHVTYVSISQSRSNYFSHYAEKYDFKVWIHLLRFLHSLSAAYEGFWLTACYRATNGKLSHFCNGWILRDKSPYKEAACISLFFECFDYRFFTGLFSFLLFSIFTYFYSKFDAEMADLLLKSTQNFISSMPSIVILLEGSAASIIVAFICMQYFRKFEEGEASSK
ncbi:MAG: hypothetical protein IPP32_04800 [Bacteroidetes bacterium]|nr:hypothetical protein [Bacteroidota bacterium]